MKKWYSVLMALFLAFAMLVVSSGCGKDAKKDSASTTATSQESLEQIFKENAQKIWIRIFHLKKSIQRRHQRQPSCQHPILMEHRY